MTGKALGRFRQTKHERLSVAPGHRGELARARPPLEKIRLSWARGQTLSWNKSCRFHAERRHSPPFRPRGLPASKRQNCRSGPQFEKEDTLGLG